MADRLPEVTEEYYFTDSGYCYFHHSFYDHDEVTWWLEEIELTTEEDIQVNLVV